MAALLNPVNAGLLRRHIDRLGLRAVLLSTDGRVTRMAAAAGIRAGRIRRASDAADWVPPRRLAAFAGFAGISLAVALVIGAALVVMPSATVTVYPELQRFDEVVQVRASTGGPRPDTGALAVPGEALEVEVQVREALDITATALTALRATGTVVVRNNGSTPVDVPTGALVGTGTGARYRLASGDRLEPGEQVALRADAEALGVAGNAPAGAVDRVVAGAAPGLTVTNPGPISGGRDQAEARATTAHYATLRGRAQVAAQAEALKRLAEQRGASLSFYEDAILIEYGPEELSPAPGAVGREAALTLHARARVVAFRGEDVNRVLRQHAAGDGGTRLVEGSLQTAPLEMVTAEGDAVVFHMRVEGAHGPRVEEEQVREMVKGKGVREAEAAVASGVALAGRARVEVQPFWAMGVSRLAALADYGAGGRAVGSSLQRE
jgi:hypothetical protein